MNENALNWLNFDELIHEAIEAKENEIHREKSVELHSVQTQDGDISDKLNKIAQTANKKINFTITDENLGVGGAKEKFRANVAAIKTLRQIEDERRAATPDEQNTLARYVGWGGIPQAFDGDNAEWASEYTQLNRLCGGERACSFQTRRSGIQRDQRPTAGSGFHPKRIRRLF